MKHLSSNPLSRAMTVESHTARESTGRQLVVNGTTVVRLQIDAGGMGGFIKAEALGGVEGGGDTAKATACTAVRSEIAWQGCASGIHDTGTGFCAVVLIRGILILRRY